MPLNDTVKGWDVLIDVTSISSFWWQAQMALVAGFQQNERNGMMQARCIRQTYVTWSATACAG